MASTPEIEADKATRKAYRALLNHERKEKVLEQCRKFDDGPFHLLTIHKDTVLHVAASCKQADLVHELLKMVPDDQHYKLTLRNKAGNTILHEASTSNKLVLAAEEMLNKAPELLNMHSNFGVTPLYRSVEFGRMKMFKFLDNRIRQRKVTTFRKVNYNETNNTTVLHAAVVNGSFALALLIAKTYKCLVNEQDDNKMTALQLLACNSLAFEKTSGGGYLKRLKRSRDLTEEMSSDGEAESSEDITQKEECGDVTKYLAKDADDDVIDRIFRIPNRTAPDILGYVPSYKGFLKKGKDPVPRVGPRRVRHFDTDISRADLVGRERVLRTTSRLPQSFIAGSGSEGSMAGASALKEAQRKERAERKRKEAEKAAALQPGHSAEGEAPEKRARTTEPSEKNKQPPAKSPVLPTPAIQTSPAEIQPKGTAPKDKQVHSATSDAAPSETEVVEPWVPVIQTSSGEPVKKNASVWENRKTAMTLLKALALPRDMKAISKNTADNYSELCTSIVMAGQSALALGDKVYNLGVEKSLVEKKLEAERKARAELKKKAETLAADDHQLERLLLEARRDQKEAEEKAVTAESKLTAAEERAAKAERDLKHAQDDHEEMMGAADKNGYDRGAEETLRKFAKEANDNEEKAFKKGYLLGRAGCWAEAFSAAYDIVAVPAESVLRTSLPPVPEAAIPEMPSDDEEDAPEGDGTEEAGTADPRAGNSAAEPSPPEA